MAIEWDFDNDLIEQWEHILDFPNYLVSSFGRIYSIPSNIIRKTVISKDTGYEMVMLNHNKIVKNKSIHRLVAHAFCPGQFDGAVVNHLDGDKVNNRYDNLEWTTYSANALHSYRLGLQEKPIGKRVRLIENGKIFNSQIECARYLCDNQSNIYRAIREPWRTVKKFHIEQVF